MAAIQRKPTHGLTSFDHISNKVSHNVYQGHHYTEHILQEQGTHRASDSEIETMLKTITMPYSFNAYIERYRL